MRSSRSARDLLSHIVGSELTFVLRTKGRQNEGESRHVDTWPGFEVLREVAASGGEDLIAIAAGLDEDEIKVTLALIGIETSDLDGWFYAPAAGYGREIANNADPRGKVVR